MLCYSKVLHRKTLMLIAWILVFGSCLPSIAQENNPTRLPSNNLDILEGEPTALIHSCVNVITGDYVDLQQDIFLPCSDPLSVQRFYCSSDTNYGEIFKSWKFNHENLSLFISRIQKGFFFSHGYALRYLWDMLVLPKDFKSPLHY